MATVDAFGAARFVSRSALPYYRRMLYGLVPHPVKDLAKQMPGTWAIGVTEDMVVFYDPELWGRLPVLFLGAALIHEGLHCLRRHAQRARALGLKTVEQLQRWNLAGDCEINDDHMEVLATLVKAVVGATSGDRKALVEKYTKFLSSWVTPDSFNLPCGKTAEWYYRNLPDDAGQQPQPQPGDGDGDGEGDDGEGQPQQFGGACGSGSGNPHPGEPKPDQGDGQGDGDGDGPSQSSMPRGRSEREIARIVRDVARDVQEEQESGKLAGTLPGGLLRWSDNMLQPPLVHWTVILQQMLRYHTSTKGGRRFETHTRTSRRQATYGWHEGVPIMPGRVDPDADIDIVVDTSGSMTLGVDLKQAVSEVKGICDALPGTSFRFHSADAIIQDSIEIRSVMDLISKGGLKGGGGTSFWPIFQLIARRRRQPHGLVYITDGYGSWPTAAPPYPVIIALTGPRPKVRGVPPWATVVFTDEEAAAHYRERSAA